MTLDECLEATLIPEHVFALHAFASSLVQRLHAKGLPLPYEIEFHGGPNSESCRFVWPQGAHGLAARVTLDLVVNVNGNLLRWQSNPSKWVGTDLDEAETHIRRQLKGGQS